MLSPSDGQLLIFYSPVRCSVSLSLSPVQNSVAQLACVTHAASVYPEPGSNSQLKTLNYLSWLQSLNKNFLVSSVIFSIYPKSLSRSCIVLLRKLFSSLSVCLSQAQQEELYTFFSLCQIFCKFFFNNSVGMLIRAFLQCLYLQILDFESLLYIRPCLMVYEVLE